MNGGNQSQWPTSLDIALIECTDTSGVSTSDYFNAFIRSMV